MTASPERDSASSVGDAASPSGDLQNSGYVTLLSIDVDFSINSDAFVRINLDLIILAEFPITGE